MLHNVIDVSFTDLIPASELLGAGVFFEWDYYVVLLLVTTIKK